MEKILDHIGSRNFLGSLVNDKELLPIARKLDVDLVTVIDQLKKSERILIFHHGNTHYYVYNDLRHLLSLQDRFNFIKEHSKEALFFELSLIEAFLIFLKNHISTIERQRQKKMDPKKVLGLIEQKTKEFLKKKTLSSLANDEFLKKEGFNSTDEIKKNPAVFVSKILENTFYLDRKTLLEQKNTILDLIETFPEDQKNSANSPFALLRDVSVSVFVPHGTPPSASPPEEAVEKEKNLVSSLLSDDPFLMRLNITKTMSNQLSRGFKALVRQLLSIFEETLVGSLLSPFLSREYDRFQESGDNYAFLILRLVYLYRLRLSDSILELAEGIRYGFDIHHPLTDYFLLKERGETSDERKFHHSRFLTQVDEETNPKPHPTKQVPQEKNSPVETSEFLQETPVENVDQDAHPNDYEQQDPPTGAAFDSFFDHGSSDAPIDPPASSAS